MIPDGLGPSLPGCRPGVFAAGPRDRVAWNVDSPGIAPESPVCRTGVFLLDHEPVSGSRGTRTHKGITPPVFKTGSSSGRMTSVELRGLESNQRPPGSEPGVATSSNHPAVLFTIRDSPWAKKVRGGGFEPPSPASKAGSLPLADPRECPAGVEPTSPAWKAGTFAARPRAQSCGGRNRTCVGVINSHLPVPPRVPPQCESARLESNQHLRAPEARGLSVSPTRR